MKFKLFLLMLSMLLNASSAMSASDSSASADNPCPTGFTFSTDPETKNKCCSMNVSCPQGFEISQACSMSGTPANSVNLKFCCKKKVIPFDCPPPAQTVMLSPKQCLNTNGVVDPNVSPNQYTDKPVKCCFNCAKAGNGFSWIQGSTSQEKCQPIPPNIFLPTYPGSKEGRCCGKQAPAYSCQKPSELIEMSLNGLTPDDCKKIGGQVNPDNIKFCCMTCGKDPLNGTSWFTSVSIDQCKPRPPRIFLPDVIVPTRGKCCSRENPVPTPTPACSPPNELVSQITTVVNSSSIANMVTASSQNDCPNGSTYFGGEIRKCCLSCSVSTTYQNYGDAVKNCYLPNFIISAPFGYTGYRCCGQAQP